MLLTDYGVLTWSQYNKKKYTNLGYEFTGYGDQVKIKFDDLPKSSKALVKAQCDYCGEVFETTFGNCTTAMNCRVKKITCNNPECKHAKLIEALSLPEVKQKRVNTNLEKYGATNPFGADVIKEKIVRTNMEKYGVPYTQQSKEVHEKTMATCLEKYGVQNYVELFKGKFIKENSPVWKGGVAAGRAERATYEYREWRTAVFNRDHYTCCKCGARNGNGYSVGLNAHHIRNWKDNTDLRYDVSNGVTLCEKCHMEFHSLYGKRDNTPEQLYDFLELDEKIC